MRLSYFLKVEGNIARSQLLKTLASVARIMTQNWEPTELQCKGELQ